MHLLILSLLIASADSTSVEKFYKEFTPFAGKGLISGVFSSANTRGKFPHITIGIGYSSNSVHNVSNPTDTNGTSKISGNYPTLTLRADIGISPGIKFAPMIGGFGSIDILYRRGILLLPHITAFHIMSDNFYFNTFGIRFGILRNSPITPAISLNYRHSTTRIGFKFAGPDSGYRGYLSPKAQSVFLSISKKFVAIIPYFGIGMDMVSANGEYNNWGTDKSFGENTPKVFGGMQLSLPVLNFNFEGGTTISGKYFGVGVKLIF